MKTKHLILITVLALVSAQAYLLGFPSYNFIPSWQTSAEFVSKLVWGINVGLAAFLAYLGFKWVKQLTKPRQNVLVVLTTLLFIFSFGFWSYIQFLFSLSADGLFCSYGSVQQKINLPTYGRTIYVFNGSCLIDTVGFVTVRESKLPLMKEIARTTSEKSFSQSDLKQNGDILEIQNTEKGTVYYNLKTKKRWIQDE
ncbi:MAG: hypothetical protein MUD14_21180 [Hydrococcus sp. Prado102]|nr:hypothetical protein [Hydrococcus sp. Prado102]